MVTETNRLKMLFIFPTNSRVCYQRKEYIRGWIL